MSAWPCCSACCQGFRPWEDIAFTSAPFAASAIAVAVCPHAAAKCKGVASTAVLASMWAPAETSATAASVCPAAAAECKGVNAPKERASMFAPAETSATAVSVCPAAAAECKAVISGPVVASMVEPAETSARATSVWPSMAAMCKDVGFPGLALASVFAPLFSNNIAISSLLLITAKGRGVTPLSSTASMLAPESSSMVTNSDLLLHITAQCKGVQPPKLGALMSSPIRLNSLRTLLVVAVRQRIWLYREFCHLAPKRLKKLDTVSL